uniref:Calcineurin-like phosphoesterase domain-containing protein n=1 Tax=Ananas comosus var. bracteatus TaxID=296719 RepID=A0A6V7Q149_ANACO|nr:unnamed protein product [Ananas comosus var. bracteatus]
MTSTRNIAMQRSFALLLLLYYSSVRAPKSSCDRPQGGSSSPRIINPHRTLNKSIYRWWGRPHEDFMGDDDKHVPSLVETPGADAVYYYRCGGVDDEFSFKPLHLVSQLRDLGQTEWTASTLSNIAKSPYDVLLLPGDLSYADGQQPLWDSFARLVSPLARSCPWMVAVGNHDGESFLVPPSRPNMQQQCSNLKAVMNYAPS